MHKGATPSRRSRVKVLINSCTGKKAFRVVVFDEYFFDHHRRKVAVSARLSPPPPPAVFQPLVCNFTHTQILILLMAVTAKGFFFCYFNVSGEVEGR